MDWAAVARGGTRLSAERASSTPGATSACAAMYTRPGSLSNDLEPALLIQDNDEAEKQDIYRENAARKKGVPRIK